MEKEILEAWSNIEKFLIYLMFDGASECSDAPWSATTAIDSLSGLQGNGKTPLEAVQNFMIQVEAMRKHNDQNHGVHAQ